MKDISTAKFIKIRLEKSYDYHHCDTMDLSRPSILVLGGEITNSSALAYNYAKHIISVLCSSGIESGIDIYVAYYKLNGRNGCLDRINLFKQDGYTIPTAFDIPNDELSLQYPEYLHQIYEFAFEPRLFHENGLRRSQKNTINNFRNMMVFTHCRGAYVINMMSKRITTDTNGYYSEQEINNIKKQLLTINHAPFAPIGKTGFSELSFLSASDIDITHYNPFHTWMKENPEKFQPCFFNGTLGNVMIVERTKTDLNMEHGIGGLAGHGPDYQFLTENGRILFANERNALITGARSMLENKDVPLPNQMLNNYKGMLTVGDRIYQEFRRSAR